MAKAKKKAKRKIAPGIYNAIVDKVVDNGDGTVTVHSTLKGKDFTSKERLTVKPLTREVSPDDLTKYAANYGEPGHQRFFVLCDRYFVYTTIGARNIHHAGNKATKLWGPGWSHVTLTDCMLRGYTFVPVPEFKHFLTNSI